MEGATSVGGIFVAVLTALAAVVGGVATWRKASSEATAASANAVEATIARRDARIDELEDHIEEMRRRERALIDFVFKLQLHIQSGHGPPPPPWPDILMRNGSQ